MRAVWVSWGITNIVGGVLVALPDEGQRLFSISRLHGPSAVDAVGALILLAGWVVLDLAIVRRRHALRELSSASRVMAVAVWFAGVALLIPAVALDLGAWWVPAVALIGGVQIAAGVVVMRARPRDVRVRRGTFARAAGRE